MEKNQPKYNKRNSSKPIAITDRDKVVLAKIADYRILTTEQIFRLCFPSMNRARKRLLQLWQHGYLKRIVRPIRLGEGSSMYLYSLSKRALRLISCDSVVGNKNNRASSLFTSHTLDINNFGISLELAARNSSDISLVSWNQSKELLMKASIKEKGTVKQIPIIPDASFALKQSDRVFHYFLEIDRGTTDLKRIALKCRGYLSIWNDKIAHAKFGIRSFRLLYVTESDKRLANMIEQLQKLKSHYHRLDLILLTTAKRYSMATPSSLFEPIWNILDTEGNIRETGLLPITSLQSSRQRAENHHCAVQNPIPVNGTPGPGG
jgi:hypothetical protein